MVSYQPVIEEADLENTFPTGALLQVLAQLINDLDIGKIRVAEKVNNHWQTNAWVKKGILLYFKFTENKRLYDINTQYYDKIPLKFNDYDDAAFRKSGVRVVPHAIARKGSYIGPKTILMPSYVNIGAYIDSGCMIDTWATVGSCAQIGKNVHISGGAGIGGVLEPLQANPTIIEDNCFIGARSEIVEGAIVKKNAVISMGVFIGQSTKIYDRTTGKYHQGIVPEGAVVVPGSLPSHCGQYNLNAAIIVKYVDQQTLTKTSVNQLLRDVAAEN